VILNSLNKLIFDSNRKAGTRVHQFNILNLSKLEMITIKVGLAHACL